MTMEQRRYSGRSHWYHETQARNCRADAQPLVPDAAQVQDRFLLDLAVPEKRLAAHAFWLDTARAAAAHLLPDSVSDTGGNTLRCYDRLSTALTVAQVCGIQRLCSHYAARLAPQPGPDSTKQSNRRLAEITQYARQLAGSPALINPACRIRLTEAGLTKSDIVTFNQIIGYIGYQARIVTLLQAFSGKAVRWLPNAGIQPDAAVECFSFSESRWQPAFMPPDQLSDAQRRVFHEASLLPPLAELAQALVEEEATLKHLVRLVHHAPQSSDAVLAALLSARINGNSYYFHRFSTDYHDHTLPEALCNGESALLAWSHRHPRQRAVIQAVEILTRTPCRFGTLQTDALLEQGFSSDEALLLLGWSALCGWLDRLTLGLGETT